MLKHFRDNLKSLSWVLWVVIGVFVLLVFFEYGTVPQGGGAMDTAATVGDEEISVDELRRAYQQQQDFYRELYGDAFSPEFAEQLQLPLRTLDGLVDQKVMLLEARRLGLTVSDEEMRDYLLEIPGLRDAQGRFVGEEVYLQLIRNMGWTVADFERQVREELLRGKMREILAESLWVSDKEIEAAYREQNEKARIRYALLPDDRLMGDVEATPEELEGHFAEHRESYRLPERREVAYLLVDLGQLRRELPVPESDIERYYGDNRAEFERAEEVQARHILLRTDSRSVEEARQGIAEIRGRIEGGEDFGSIAREVSEDPGSAARGGDLGYFPRGQMTPEFEQAAFAASTGELVGPVETPFGVHLLEVTDRREGGQRELSEVREEIRARLADERVTEVAERTARELAETLREEGVTDAEGLERIAAGYPGVSVNTPEAVSELEPLPGLGRSPDLSSAIFAVEAGETTDPVRVPRGWAVALVEEVEPPRERTLEEVEAEVRTAVERRKARQLAGERLRAAVEAGSDLDTIAAELGVTATESPEFGPQGTIPGLGRSPRLTAEAMRAEPGTLVGPFETPGGTVVFEVVERTEFDPAAFAEAREDTRNLVEERKLNRLVTSLLRERRRDLDVRFDRRVLENLGIREDQLVG